METLLEKFEVFVNNTNLTFLSLCTKLTLRCLKKIKLPPVGFELTTLPSLVYKSDADPTELSRHVLNRRSLN